MKKQHSIGTIFIVIMAVILALGLTSCGGGEKNAVNVGVIKGPTGLGALHLMKNNDDKKTANAYNITIAASPDEVSAKIISGELDIAAVPTNLAAVLDNKMGEHGVTFLAINTLGVLHLMERGTGVSGISGLEGKTVYSAGQGAVPEYALSFILEKNGLIPGENVTVEYLSEHAELAVKMIAGEVSACVLPEPFVTNVLIKGGDGVTTVDLTKEWEKIAPDSALAMGGIIVRDEFIEKNRDAVKTFLEEYKASVEAVLADTDEAAALSETYDIMPAAVAKQAIPNCNIVYIDGQEMKTALMGFFEVLFTQNPASLGGRMPDESFYFID